jgi:hypothetical protein
MHGTGTSLSRLPSFLLPCQHCGNRMEITTVVPAWGPDDVKASDDLEDVIHACMQCGTTLTRTVRRPAERLNRA